MKDPGEGQDSLAKPATLRSVWWVVVVASLGYFVDIYDLVLFSILRVPSLKGLGIAESSLKTTGALLLDIQLVGMMVGGVAVDANLVADFAAEELIDGQFESLASEVP